MKAELTKIDIGNGFTIEKCCPRKTVMWDLFQGNKYLGTFKTLKAAKQSAAARIWCGLNAALPAAVAQH